MATTMQAHAVSTRPVPVHKMKDSKLAALTVGRHLLGLAPDEPHDLVAISSVRELAERSAGSEPVIVSGRFPVDPPNADGYWPILRGGDRERRTVIVVGFSTARKAFRVVESRGVGWGQAGRAWVTEADMGRILAVRTGRAWRITREATS